MIRNLVGGLAIAALTAATASAQGFVNAKYAGEFLGLGVGGRSAALGGAGTGFANDVTAGYFNPAGLTQVNYPQGALLHESRFSGQINYDYAGFALPIFGGQTIGLSAIRVGLDGIKDSREALIDRNGNGKLDEDDRIDMNQVKIGGAADWAILGSYARRIDSQLAVGGSVKFFYKSVLEHSAWGVGFDVSAAYKPTEALSLGATLSRSGAIVKRISLTAQTCTTCGVVGVYVGSTQDGRVNLASATSARKTFVLPAFSLRSGTVKVKVLSTNKLVRIDALGLSRS